METSIKSTLFNDMTYVGIFKKDADLYIHILHSQLPCLTDNHYKLVYIRGFAEVLLALGYKETLQKLSVSSLKSIILKENPEMKDIREQKK